MSEMFTCDTGHEGVVYVADECPACAIRIKLYLAEAEIEKLEKIKIKELTEAVSLV